MDKWRQIMSNVISRITHFSLWYFDFLYQSRQDDEITEELTCPECEDIFYPSEIIRDNYSRKQLEKVVIYCQNKGNGCQTEMKMKELDAHLESCSFQTIDCVHRSHGCSAVLLRGQLSEHLSKECQFRLATCSYCEEQFSLADLKVNGMMVYSDWKNWGKTIK